MILPDVNVLIYAHREESPEHGLFADWLTKVATAEEPFGISELVLSAIVRIVTNPRVFKVTTPLEMALEFTDELRQRPNAVCLRAGARHWEIFQRLCRQSGATGKLVADAYHAALAIEHGCEWITTDADFARFPGLRWRHPLRPR